MNKHTWQAEAKRSLFHFYCHIYISINAHGIGHTLF
jgi:hypothetical protein